MEIPREKECTLWIVNETILFRLCINPSQRNGTKSESMDRLKTSTHKFSCIENKGTSFLTHAGSTWNRWDGNWRGGIFLLGKLLIVGEVA